MGDFSKAVKFVLSDRIEGGYTVDTGGPTNMGISERFLRSIGDRRDVRALTREDAIELYHQHFWRPIYGDDMPDDLALCVFDCAVNQGVGAAVRNLQEALNGQFDYGLKVDGIFGPLTRGALFRALREQPDTHELEFRYILLRLVKYADLADRSARHRQYIRGWLNRALALFQEVD